MKSILVCVLLAVQRPGHAIQSHFVFHNAQIRNDICITCLECVRIAVNLFFADLTWDDMTVCIQVVALLYMVYVESVQFGDIGTRDIQKGWMSEFGIQTECLKTLYCMSITVHASCCGQKPGYLLVSYPCFFNATRFFSHALKTMGTRLDTYKRNSREGWTEALVTLLRVNQ